jgi:CDP-diacylglycerol--glycerol-3-phosphate 3-phosphatidyltransferase
MIKVHKESIPWAMAAGRALLGPVLILGERCGWSGVALASLVLTALLSDIFDGVLARTWHCDTANVRLFDSMADIAFYICVAVALGYRHPHIWYDNALLLGTVLSLEVMRFIVDFAKFGKPASYHSYLAKTWGLIMAIAVVATLASRHAGILIPGALVFGIACNLEGLAMSFILPVWRRDVKTLAAARRMRRELAPPQPRTPRRRPTLAVVTSALMLAVLIALPASALEPDQAVYIGGSAAVVPDTVGALDTSSPTTLFFHYQKPDGTAGEIGIQYAAIKTAWPSNEVTHHLGVAPAIAVGLLAPRRRRYFITLTWVDEGGIAQAAQLEISKHVQQPVMAVIRARMPQPCQRASTPCVRPSAWSVAH